MKIYTRTGDKGETSLLGGARVSKSHYRIDVYGEVDELNSHLGFLLTFVDTGDPERALILKVQSELFKLGSLLAATKQDREKFKLQSVSEEIILALETSIDKMNSNLPELKNFILPGGGVLAAHSHICRTVCRRVERKLVWFSNSEEELPDSCIKLINRLSDYLFTFSRLSNLEEGVEETIWKP